MDEKANQVNLRKENNNQEESKAKFQTVKTVKTIKTCKAEQSSEWFETAKPEVAAPKKIIPNPTCSDESANASSSATAPSNSTIIPSSSSSSALQSSSSQMVQNSSSTVLAPTSSSNLFQSSSAFIDASNLIIQTEGQRPTHDDSSRVSVVPARNLLTKQGSSMLYQNELDQLMSREKISCRPGVRVKSKEYKLVDSEKKFVRPEWIKILPKQRQIDNCLQLQLQPKSAVLINDEDVIRSSEFIYHKDHKLFTNKRNTFYTGKYRGRVALVKRVFCGKAEVEVDLIATWINIAKSVGAAPPETRCSSFIEIYEVFYLSTTQHFFIFSELAPKKTLHYHVKDRKPLDINQARTWSAQILNGICYLQNNGISHKSIRLEHLLLNVENEVKIINFRRAVFFVYPDTAKTKLVAKRERRLRQNNHLPPEAFNDNYDPQPVDVWSFGVTLCALTTFRYPFQYKNKLSGGGEQEWKSFKERHRPSLHDHVMALLDVLFVDEITKRISPGQIQDSAFFKC